MSTVMTRLLGWIVHSDTPRPRPSLGRALILLALLLVALGSVAHGLANVVRELDARLLLTVATLGALGGWMMAMMHLPDWLSGILVSWLGAGVILVRVGRLGGKLLAIVWALVNMVREIWRWLLSEGWRMENGEWRLVGPPPDWMAVSLALTELWADIVVLLDRGREWLMGLFSGHSAFDPVATALAWSLAMWIVAVWAGWMVRRHQPLKGMAPAGALLVVTFSYTGVKPIALLTLLGATLLLMALVQHDARERRWRTTSIDFSSDLWKDIAVTAALLSLALVVMAALTPSISVQKIIELAQQLTVRQGDETESVANSLGLEVGPNLERPVLSKTRATDRPRVHLITLKPELSRRVVMVIYTNDLRPDLGKSQIAPTDRNLLGSSEPARHYYWRGMTYDHYGGHGWSAGRTVTLKYEAGEPVISEDVPFHRVIRQEIQIFADPSTSRQARGDASSGHRPSTSSGHRPDEMLYVAGILVTADQDFSVARRSPQDIFGAFTNATTYRAESLVPVVNEERLQSAGSDYPEWIRGRYLTLPDQVPDRVLALARDLTATEPTPYDRALAIESYLRTFPYTLDVPLPPSDRDIADYFLFDLQQGYCEYYATAMAVLARAAGLPARLVVGYASGTYDANKDRYIVTEADAHTWVEIYFPKYGWVEFEPTGKRPPLERLAESPLEWPELARSPEPSGLLELVSGVPSRVLQFWWLGVLGSLALASLASVIRSVVDGWRLHLLTPVATATILYRRLQRHGRRLAVTMREGDTPYEFAMSFAEHFAHLARGKYGWDTILAPAVQEAQWLVSLYVQASYTPRSPNTDDQREGIQTWGRLHRRLWVAWVLHKLKRGGKT